MTFPGAGTGGGAGTGTGAVQGQNVSAVVGTDIIAGLEQPPVTAQPVTAAQPVAAMEVTTGTELQRILAILTAVNDIRAQIIRLGLNPALRFAIETEVVPVLNILTALATAADFFSVTAFNMHNINFAKTHETRKTLELIYNIVDLSEDVFEVLNKLVLATLPKSPY